MSIDRDLRTLRDITKRLSGKKFQFDKEINEMLEEIGEKAKVPYKCLWCGEIIPEKEINFHKCKGRRYLNKIDKKAFLQKDMKSSCFRFYKLTFYGNPYWFEDIKYMRKFIKLLHEGKCIKDAIEFCGSEFVKKARFPKFEEKEVNENVNNDGNRESIKQ